MSELKTVDDLNVQDKIVLLRCDFNVPVRQGLVLDDTKIKEHLETIQLLQQRRAKKIVLLSHFQRPQGVYSSRLSLRHIIPALSKVLHAPITFLDTHLENPSLQQQIHNSHTEQIILLENVRFYPQEETNDPHFAKLLANLGDLYVNDAFPVCHREHASVVSITRFLPAAMGRELFREINTLSSILQQHKTPLVIVVGGAKIDSKIGILQNLAPLAENLIVGGGMANTFLAAQQYNVGHSFIQKDKIHYALSILQNPNIRISLPHSVAVTKYHDEYVNESPNDNPYFEQNLSIQNLKDEHVIVDVGLSFLDSIQSIVAQAGTIVWNGPLGIYENPQYRQGTIKLAAMLANSKALKIAGGGETIHSIHLSNYQQHFHHISNGGGAFLKWLELFSQKQLLPGIQALLNNYETPLVS